MDSFDIRLKNREPIENLAKLFLCNKTKDYIER